MGEHAPEGPAAEAALRLAGGRALPSLLFVTNSAGLAGNIGAAEAGQVLAMIADGRHCPGPHNASRVLDRAPRRPGAG